jgi:hypothetical protein
VKKTPNKTTFQFQSILKVVIKIVLDKFVQKIGPTYQKGILIHKLNKTPFCTNGFGGTL